MEEISEESFEVRAEKLYAEYLAEKAERALCIEVPLSVMRTPVEDVVEEKELVGRIVRSIDDVLKPCVQESDWHLRWRKKQEANGKRCAKSAASVKKGIRTNHVSGTAGRLQYESRFGDKRKRAEGKDETSVGREELPVKMKKWLSVPVGKPCVVIYHL